MDYDALRLFLHLSRTLRFSADQPRMPRQPVGAVARDPAPGARGRLAAARARPPHGAADARGDALRRRTRATTLERWDEAARASCAAARARSRARIALFASVTACQSFLPELLSGFRAALPRHPHPARDRLRRRRAGDAGRGARRRQRSRRCPRACRRRWSRACCCTRRWCSSAPRAAVRGRAPDAQRRPLPWAELPIVLPASGLARDGADRWFRRQRIAPAHLRRGAGQRGDPALVSLGCGVGIVPRLVIDKSPLRAKVRASTSSRRGTRRVPRRRLHPAPQAAIAARARVLGRDSATGGSEPFEGSELDQMAVEAATSGFLCSDGWP